MKGVKRPLGYTIVEVMIVLAVSGVMFVIAANFISGKQEKTSFQQGSNELASRIQGLIEQVTDGQYTDIPMTCTSTTGVSLDINGAASPNQGTNPQCVFLGKMMHFSVDSNRNKYEIFSLAGTRLKSDGTPAIALNETLLTPVDFPGATPSINLTSQATMPQNLDVTDMLIIDINDATQNDKYAFGFMQGLGTAGAASGTYQSGAQTISMIFADSIGENESEADAATSIKASTVKVAKSVCIAIYDGTRGALVNIGADNGSQLSVSVKQLGTIGTEPTC